MKLNQLILPTFALTMGAALLLPAQNAKAWTHIGGKLNLGDRDFRIYNNFTDGAANNNQTPDANFPGHQGAVMAIWKACIEWGSELHGNGDGDPHQVFGLGSGGANFDASFQGEATEVGSPIDNTHSEIGGSSGGVLAYTEGAGGPGWRIRYYRGWTWNDGPGTNVGNNIDLQGVACHEYGHALGMGHSGASGATMRPSISGSGVSARSINSDDIAGIKAKYNPIDVSKPHITGFTVSGSTIQVIGSNFEPTGNQIWFTQGSPGGDGIPIKVIDLTSNGTLLTANIPTNIGPGDILVRRNGTGNIALSNAWPSDLVPGVSCSIPLNYCSVSENSAGSGGTISFSNEPSLSANNFQLHAIGLAPNKPGLFFYGPNKQEVIFGEGVLCVGGSIKRLPVQITDGFGIASESLDFNSPPFDSGSGQAVVDGTMHFQFWFRDPGFGPGGFNTTDGLEVTFCP